MRKEFLNIIVLLLFVVITTNTFAQTNIDNFKSAKQQLENMLSGNDSLSYEKAIYIIEHAYNGDKTSYQDFQQTISFYTEYIKRIIETQKVEPSYKPENFYQFVRQSPEQYKVDFNKALTNFGIFTFMTDTTFFRLDSNLVMYNLPYQYSTSDPMGTTDWSNTQVTNLLETGKGNCFALSSLFKIFADRLQSDATLCTAPNHIYIRHLDEKGTRYNIDLASSAFPLAGTLQTLTYTTKEALKNDISLRKLTTQQAVALCVVYLAKGYEYKLNVKDDFMLQCAEMALKYDSLNLNAMLLKAEYLEYIIKQQNKNVAQLQTNKDFKQYEKLIAHLYNLGYREMPLDMKNVLVHGWKKDTTILYLQNHEIVKKDETRRWTLSSGLFDEDHAYKPIEQYGQTLFDCKTQKIKGFVKEKPLYNDYTFDPVAFAWNVDPLAHKFAGESPYSAFGDNPIYNIDVGGAYKYPASKVASYTKNFPIITKYLSQYIQNDIAKSQIVQNAVVENTYGGYTNDELINTVAKWNNGPEIEFKQGLSKETGAAVGLTLNSKKFQIDYDYAKAIEKILQDKNISQEDRQAALLKFYETVLDETTHTGDYKDNVKNAPEVGKDAVNKIFHQEDVTVNDNGKDVVIPNVLFPDTKADNKDIGGAKDVIQRKTASGKTEVLPTVPATK